MQIGASSTLSFSAGIRQQFSRLLANPAFVLFVSANIVNVGNLVFNVLFSRWLGPELFSDLALLLTIKLSILCILSAVQFEIAGRVARNISSQAISLAANKTGSLLKVLLAASGVLMVLSGLSVFLLLPKEHAPMISEQAFAFILFAACLPFAAPLCILRGLSQGRLDLKYIVLSAQIEMAVRLVGATLAWFAGLGLPGIAVAIALSIIAGWWFAAPPVPDKAAGANRPSLCGGQVAEENHSSNDILDRSLLLAALPWGLLQLGQVIALDGDFLAIKLFFSAEESGQAAVAVLVQRILFFGCFGLASALLPMAAGARTRAELNHIILLVLGLFAAVTLPFVLLVTLFPNEIVTMVFGPSYLEAAPALAFASMSGACFVLIYLIATFFMARQKPRYGLAVLATALAIVLLLSLLAAAYPQAGTLFLIKTKAALLFVACLGFIGIAWNEISRDKSSQVP